MLKVEKTLLYPGFEPASLLLKANKHVDGAFPWISLIQRPTQMTKFE